MWKNGSKKKRFAPGNQSRAVGGETISMYMNILIEFTPLYRTIDACLWFFLVAIHNTVIIR